MGKKEQWAALKMGKAQPALVQILKAQRTTAVKDTAFMMGLAEDGQPFSKNDILMNRNQMGEALSTTGASR
jgi:hypothetical protein